MSATLINLTGFTWGFASDETGINIERMTIKTGDKSVMVPDKQGATRGYVSYDLSQDITLDGETDANNGLMAAVIGTAVTLANTISGFGVNAGNIYLREATLELGRESLQKLSITGKRWPAF